LALSVASTAGGALASGDVDLWSSSWQVTDVGAFSIEAGDGVGRAAHSRRRAMIGRSGA
jgi:hypothetical protein